MQAWLEINRGSIVHNLEQVRAHIGGSTDIIGVVKSDAYGHGITEVAPILQDEGVSMLAVISLPEALKARAVCRLPILIMGYLDHKEIIQAIEQGFHLSLYEKGLMTTYERLAQKMQRKVNVHAILETGLHREGMSPEDLHDCLETAHVFPHVQIAAIFSHLYRAADREKNLEQLKELQDFLRDLGDKAATLPIHLASSYSLKNFREGYFDAVRIGLAFFGIDEVLPDLRPVMQCKARVMQVKNIKAGDGVSYDHLYVADRDRTIAIVSIGYADGLTQKLDGVMTVLINGEEVPVIGKICMNLIIADVTSLETRMGDEVVIIGSQTNRRGETKTIRVSDLARRAGLRHHEIVTRLGLALPRIYI